MNFNPMQEAIAEARAGVDLRQGGPFGAVVVRDQKIIGRGHNRVVAEHDPTAHAEIAAIRAACRQLGDFNLEGAVLYTTCYPCPMCLGAILWARITKVYYCLTSTDVAAIGFDDDSFYNIIRNKEQQTQLLHHAPEEKTACFDLLQYYQKTHPQLY